jgi:WD40 repeat protein
MLILVAIISIFSVYIINHTQQTLQNIQATAAQSIALVETQVDDAALQLTNASHLQATVVSEMAEHSTAIAVMQPTIIGLESAIETGEKYIQALRLVNLAESLLIQNTNAEVIALLGIRSLSIAYTPQADSLLGRSLAKLYTRKVFNIDYRLATSIALHPDGKTFITAGENREGQGIATLWDIESGAQRHSFTGHTDNITNVAFSPDGITLLTSSTDGTVRLWDVQTAANLQTWRESANDIAFSQDGTWIVLSSSQKDMAIWLDAKTGSEIGAIQHPSGDMRAVALSPDKRTLLTGGNEGGWLWDTQTGLEINGYPDLPIVDLAFSPDGTTFFFMQRDNQIRIFNMRGGQNPLRIQSNDMFRSAVYSSNGLFILTDRGDYKAVLWDIKTAQPFRYFEGHSATILNVAFHPTAPLVLTNSTDNTVRLWDASLTGELSAFKGHTDDILSVAASPDGKFILTGSRDTTARLWDVATGREIRRYQGNQGTVYSVAFSPDGSQLVTGHSDGVAILWYTHANAPLQNFVGHQDTLIAVAFNPDGQTVLTASLDLTARLWDVQSGTLQQTFTGHTGGIKDIAFSPDGKHILTGSEDYTAILWDIETGAPINSYTGHENMVLGVAFSPDGQYIATASYDQTVRLWDAQTGVELKQFNGHTNQVNSVVFSPDGKTLLTGSGGHDSDTDLTARVWDIDTGEELRRFDRHQGQIQDVAFSPDTRFVITVGADDLIHLWDRNIDDFIRQACSLIFRDFTPTERQNLGIPDSEPTCP